MQKRTLEVESQELKVGDDILLRGLYVTIVDLAHAASSMRVVTHDGERASYLLTTDRQKIRRGDVAWYRMALQVRPIRPAEGRRHFAYWKALDRLMCEGASPPAEWPCTPDLAPELAEAEGNNQDLQGELNEQVKALDNALHRIAALERQQRGRDTINNLARQIVEATS